MENVKRELPISEDSRKIIIGGRYRHYKNLFYKVLALARHSESLEELVVYQAEYGEKGIWVRPKKMFMESIEINGKNIFRFDSIEEENT